MGARSSARTAEILGQGAVLEVENAKNRRIAAEQQRAIEQSLLGTDAQVAGQLGGVNASVAPYTARYTLNNGALSGITDVAPGNVKNKLNTNLGAANDMLAQAEQLARAGDLQGAAQLKAQAEKSLLSGVDFQIPVQSAYSQLFTLTQDPTTAATANLNSPVAQLVGQNLQTGRAFADPNSAQSQRLFADVVTTPANTIQQGLDAALAAIGSRTNAALGDVATGFAQALSAVSGGTEQALAFINEGFGAAISALEVGRATSLAEIDKGLAAGIDAVRLQTQNALRSIEAGTRETRRASVDAMRQRGAAARPLAQQAVANRATERFDTQRAVAETESGRLQSLLQAGASSEKAGVMERTGQGIGQLQAQGALARADVQQQSTALTANLNAQQATLQAQLQQQAGMLEAQLNVQANIAKGDVLQRGAMFVEQFRADYAFQSAAAAQAFLNNQPGTRDAYLASLDQLDLAQAGLIDNQAGRAQQMALFYAQVDAEQEANRRKLATQVIGLVGAVATGGLLGAAGGLLGAAGGALGSAGASLGGVTGSVVSGLGTAVGALGTGAGALGGALDTALPTLLGNGRAGQASNQNPGRIFGQIPGSTPPINPNAPAPGDIDPFTGRPRIRVQPGALL